MGRPALASATRQAIREAAVEFVHRQGKATPAEVVRELQGKGEWYRVKLTPHRLGAILKGETRIGRFTQNYSSDYRYIWRGD